MTFSEKLLKKRRQLGLSQEALAEKLDVSRQAVSRWELGTAMPDAAKLLALSDLFGMSVDALLRDEMPMEAPQNVEIPVDTREKPVRGGRGWRAAGISVTVLAVAGLLALGILSSVFPPNFGVTAEVGPDGVEYIIEQPQGLQAFLFKHDLEWLYNMCVACVPAGIAVACMPEIIRYMKRQ